jgi:hypothetical protein
MQVGAIKEIKPNIQSRISMYGIAHERDEARIKVKLTRKRYQRVHDAAVVQVGGLRAAWRDY